MSTRNLAAGALALTTIATLTLACQSGLSIGGHGAQKPAEEHGGGERAARGDRDDSGEDGASGEGDEDAREDGEGGERAEPAAVAGDGKLMPWCRGKDTGHQLGNVEQNVHNGVEFDTTTIWSLALVGCDSRRSDDIRESAQAYYEKLAKWSKLPAGELDVYLHALVEDAAPIKKACDRLDLADNAQRGLGKLLACGETGPGEKDPYWIEDDTSSAIAALAAVYQCLARGGTYLGGVKKAEDETSYALCGAEWRVLTMAAVDKELASLKVAPAARARVHIAFRQVESTARLTDEYLAPKVKEDATLKAFYYDIPDRAFAAAYRVAREGADDLGAVRAFEAKFSRSAHPQVKGCYGELRQRLIALLRRKKVKSLEKAHFEMVGPIGYQISHAVEACARKDGQEKMGDVIGNLMERADDFRGPRTMVYWFLYDELKRMEKAGEGEPPTTVDELARLRPATPNPLGRPQGAQLELSQGKIKKVSRHKGGVLLEFETVVSRTEDRDCWDTKKIHSVNSDGSFTYYKECGKWKKVTRRTKEAPVFIAAENAGGLARGRTVQIYCDKADNYRATEHGDLRICAPVAVEAGKGKNVDLVAFLGAAM